MTDLPPGYKMTELGPLPQEWQVAELGQVVEFTGRRGLSPYRATVPFIPMTLVPTGPLAVTEWELRTPEEVRSGVPVRDGDVLLAKITPCLENGKQGIVRGLPGGWGYASTEIYAMHPNPSMLAEFLALYLKLPAVREDLAGKMQGTTGRQRLPKDALIALPIPLPPLPEQRAIAHVLRTVQDAIEATERVIAATKELKRSLMRHLFTYGPVPVQEADRVPLKDTEIGPVPQHWAVVPLGDVVVGTQYGLSRRGQSAGEYPILRMNNLEEGSVRTDDLQYVDLPEDEYRKYSLTSGDILFNRTNSYELVGKTALFESSEPFVFASYLVRVVPDHSKLLPRYLNFYLNSEAVQNRLRTLATRGASQSNISATKLRSLIVGLPPLPEQRQSVEWLAAVDGKVRSERMRLQGLRTLFSSLLQNLMTGKVRVSEFAPPEPQEAM
ncbi:MAG: hypothetical protein HPY83_01215 [Anaerolineae bacterium]|nr:hypothetical protein [Anaerolineae bacterium]